MFTTNSIPLLTKMTKTFLATTCAAVLVWCPLEHATAQSPSIQQVDGGRGDVPLYIPSDYDGSEPLPLIVSLHGYTANGAWVENYFELSGQIEEKQFLLAVPDGLRDSQNNRSWNAYGCCGGTGFDDATYLRGLVDTISDDYAVDANRIHFVGHSNGGFMSHRMAIDHSDMVASIASFAGTNAKQLPRRTDPPSHPVHVLQIHGTSDGTIPYDDSGGTAGAREVVEQWVDFNDLQLEVEQVGDPFPLDANSETGGIGLTTREIYDLDNNVGVAVELWTMSGSSHIPDFGDGDDNLFAPLTVDWLLAHPKVNAVPEPATGLLISQLFFLSLLCARRNRPLS